MGGGASSQLAESRGPGDPHSNQCWSWLCSAIVVVVLTIVPTCPPSTWEGPRCLTGQIGEAAVADPLIP